MWPSMAIAVGTSGARKITRPQTTVTMVISQATGAGSLQPENSRQAKECGNGDAMHQTIDDKGPARTMPDACHQEGDDRWKCGDQHEATDTTQAPAACLAHAAHGQAGIDVGGEEARHGHVPAAPEVGDVGGLEGRVEIQRQLDAEDRGQADRHVGIAGEVEVELQRIAKGADPCGCASIDMPCCGTAEYTVGIGRNRIGQEQLS